MNLARVFRHLFSSARRTRAQFTPAVLAAIEAEIGAAEARHAGQIRFVIETALPLHSLWHDLGVRARALELFAALQIWDTAANNGVLIYVLRADRAVEIIADRGISASVPEGEWRQVCAEVEQHYGAGRFLEGSRAAIAGVARLLTLHFPADPPGANELPNQPILL